MRIAEQRAKSSRAVSRRPTASRRPGRGIPGRARPPRARARAALPTGRSSTSAAAFGGYRAPSLRRAPASAAPRQRGAEARAGRARWCRDRGNGRDRLSVPRGDSDTEAASISPIRKGRPASARRRDRPRTTRPRESRPRVRAREPDTRATAARPGTPDRRRQPRPRRGAECLPSDPDGHIELPVSSSTMATRRSSGVVEFRGTVVPQPESLLGVRDHASEAGSSCTLVQASADRLARCRNGGTVHPAIGSKALRQVRDLTVSAREHQGTCDLARRLKMNSSMPLDTPHGTEASVVPLSDVPQANVTDDEGCRLQLAIRRRS